MANNTELVTVRINKELANILKNTAKDMGLNPTSYMRSILETHATEKRTLLKPNDPFTIEQIQNSIRQISFLYFALTEDFKNSKPKLLEFASSQNEKLFPL